MLRLLGSARLNAEDCRYSKLRISVIGKRYTIVIELSDLILRYTTWMMRNKQQATLETLVARIYFGND